MFNVNYLLIAFAVLVIGIGQLVFKYAARQLSFEPGQSILEAVIANRAPIALVSGALALYFLSTLAWIQALRTVPLSVAYLFTAMSFILVPAGAFVLFNEQLPRFFFFGALLIISGIALISRG